MDLLAGLKLTGRAGPWTVGLLDVQIDEHAGVKSTNLLVGRVALQVLAESSAGIIFTHGDPRFNGENSLLGADFNYTNNHLSGDHVLTANATIQYTDSDFVNGRGAAGTIKVSLPNEPFGASINLARIGNDYDPALGFVSRTGVNLLSAWTRYRWNFKDRLVNNVDLSTEATATTDLHGRLLDRGFWYPELEIDTVPGDYLYGHYQDHREILDVPFAIRPGIVIPAGRYDWGSPRFIAGTTRSRPVDVRVDFQGGGFYGGTQRSYQFNVGYRPSNHFEFGLNYNLRQIRLPQGAFDLRIGEARATYTFTPDLQLSLLAQYDNFSREVGANFRFKWTVRPGDDVFLIVNQGYDTSGDAFRPTQNDTSLKAAWTLRF